LEETLLEKPERVRISGNNGSEFLEPTKVEIQRNWPVKLAAWKGSFSSKGQGYYFPENRREKRESH
jgi:hypothetical protein